MKRLLIRELEVILNEGVASIRGAVEVFPPTSTATPITTTPFSNQEIKEMIAAILQNLTSVGDLNGNPISENVTISNNQIIGNQSVI